MNNIEFGTYKSSNIISDKNIKRYKIYYNNHNIKPNVVITSYATYDYFCGYCHINSDTIYDNYFEYIYTPVEIGNGKGFLIVHWIEIWK